MHRDYKGIYIVGMPRSGTTLVNQLIGTDSSCMTFPETHLFNHGRFLFAKKVLFYKYILANFFVFKKMASLNLKTGLLPKNHIEFIQYVHNRLVKRAKGCNKSIYIEKTPSHLYFVPQLVDALGSDIKIIYVRRNSDDCVKSYIKLNDVWNRPINHSNEEMAYARWFHDNTLIFQFHRHYGGLIVDYDSIIDPVLQHDTICQIEEFLSIDIQLGSEKFINVASDIVSSDEYWKDNNFKQIILKSAKTRQSKIMEVILEKFNEN